MSKNFEHRKEEPYLGVLKKTVCPDWSQFCHFGQIFKVFGNFMRVYLELGKNLNLLFAVGADFQC